MNGMKKPEKKDTYTPKDVLIAFGYAFAFSTLVWMDYAIFIQPKIPELRQHADIVIPLALAHAVLGYITKKMIDDRRKG